MAVIIQQVIGSEHGSYWYPNAAGVARSLNYYPLGGEKPENGVGLVSFGFGKAVVDSGSALRFSPSFPKRPAHYLGGNQTSSQRSFYALSLNDGFDPTGERGLENLVLLDLSEAEQHPEALRYIASTWDVNSSTFSEAVSAEGMKVITFNGILKYDAFPLSAIIRDILTLGSQASGAAGRGSSMPVNLNRKAPKKPEFSLLQIRPIALGRRARCPISKEERERSLSTPPSCWATARWRVQDFVHLKLETSRCVRDAAHGLELEADQWPDGRRRARLHPPRWPAGWLGRPPARHPGLVVADLRAG